MNMNRHSYVARDTGEIRSERLFGDRVVRFLYTRARERAPSVFDAATGPRMSRLLGWVNYDAPFGPSLLGSRRFLTRCGIDLDEAVLPAKAFRTPRAVFERQIRYWDCRPLPRDRYTVTSPADSRALIGSLSTDAAVFLKGKFFELCELLGLDKPEWHEPFWEGDAAIFRLTPEQYHYTHVPVSGVVQDIYSLDGTYHACHPVAAVEVVTPISKNGRTVTVIDTDVPGGTQVGLVAMVEVVALMIGRLEPRYSEVRYEQPRSLRAGDFVRRGAVKSLFRPGSSSVVLLFERDRVVFACDLARNAVRHDVTSLLSFGFGQPLVETDVQVRSPIAHACR